MSTIQNNQTSLKKINPHLINIAIIGTYFLFEFFKYPSQHHDQAVGLLFVCLIFIAMYFIDQMLVRLIFFNRIKDKSKFVLRSFLSLLIPAVLTNIFFLELGSFQNAFLIFILIRPIALSFLMNKSILSSRAIFFSGLGVLLLGILELILGILVLNLASLMFNSICSLILPRG